MIRTVLDDATPNNPTLARQFARRVRAWLKCKRMSSELRESLEDLELRLSEKAEDVVAQQQETETAINRSEAEARGTPGVYVYTLPHHRRHPIDPETGRTFLKVGHSSKDAFYRAGSAGRVTALPEDPILLRIYPTDDSRNVEKTFHHWLKDADHNGSRTKGAGVEWFLTSTKFLDRIAQSLNLRIEIISGPKFDD